MQSLQHAATRHHAGKSSTAGSAHNYELRASPNIDVYLGVFIAKFKMDGESFPRGKLVLEKDDKKARDSDAPKRASSDRLFKSGADDDNKKDKKQAEKGKPRAKSASGDKSKKSKGPGTFEPATADHGIRKADELNAKVGIGRILRIPTRRAERVRIRCEHRTFTALSYSLTPQSPYSTVAAPSSGVACACTSSASSS